MKKLITLFAFSLLLLIPASTLPVFGLPTELIREESDLCDELPRPPITSVHELGSLGTSLEFLRFQDELITSEFGGTHDDDSPCTDTDNPNLDDLIVEIRNTTPIPWTDLWYIADLIYQGSGSPLNQFSNIDWTVTGPGGGPVPAFRIDADGVNSPLIAEIGGVIPGVFEPGEIWRFVVQDWRFPTGVGLDPHFLGSAVWPSDDPDVTSTASIVAVPFVDPSDTMLWIEKSHNDLIPDGDFNFQITEEAGGTIFANCVISTTNGMGSCHFEGPTTLPPGDYTVAEVNDENLIAADCGQGTGTAFTLNPGDMVTCTFHNMIEPPPEEGIGGKIIPIESTSLILAGAQSFSWMIPVTLSVLGIGLFAISRKSS